MSQENPEKEFKPAEVRQVMRDKEGSNKTVSKPRTKIMGAGQAGNRSV